MVDHERTVTIERTDDHGEVVESHTVTPEVARAMARRGFTIANGAPVADENVEDRIALAVDDATAPLLARIADLEAGGDGVPEKVDDVKAWVDSGTAARAQVALDAETAGQNRSTLIAHLQGVLNPDNAGDGSKEA